jgi:6-phosphofructokinase 1
MENYEKLGLDALISIGGDGSMRISAKFMDKGMNIVGVPKTIDNDLPGTDQTFGFDTAVDVATDALDRLRDTADSHDRVILVEVMGREAGWIALHAGIAGGADGILIPEIPYSIEPLADMIRRRREAGKNYSLVCVAEGARPKGGEMSVGERAAGAMPRLMGAAHRVVEELRAHLEADMRVTVLGHVQRGGSPSSFDRVLATRYGIAAAELVAAEEFGKMVALRNGEIVSVDIADVAGPPSLVDPQSQIVCQARDMGVCFGE